MQEQGIIEPLGEQPSSWCHPMVVVPKPKGGYRICVDLTRLNEHVLRPMYPTKTPKEAINNIKPRSKFFTTLDSKNGYW